ncbi:MAG: PspA/IM30 family protein [Microcoleaceae cyanobacterium]
MKQFIYWLMGERAGKVTLDAWDWLLGRSPEAEAPDRIAEAEATLTSIQASVQQLSQAVTKQKSAYNRIKQKYAVKVQERENLEQQTIVAQEKGDESAARLTMARVMKLEEFLPQLQEQVIRAEEYLKIFQEKLDQEQFKLETCRTELENLKDLQDVNQALTIMTQVNQESEQVRFEVEQQNLEQQAMIEMTLGSDVSLENDFNQMAESDEIAQRLRQLRSRSSEQK